MMMPHSVNNESPLLKLCCYAFFLLFMSVAAIYTFKKPQYNWDMLAYMGATLSIENHDAESVHSTVYNTIAKELPATQYHLLTDTTHPYKKQNLENAALFHQYLPFYIIKPLYIGLIYAGYKLGVPLVMATVLPGTLSYFLIGLLLFNWLKRYTKLIFALALSVLIMLSSPLLFMAELSTPDCLSTLMFFVAVFFLFEKKQLRWGYLFLLLYVAARIDNIIASLVLLTFITVSHQSGIVISKRKYCIMAATLLMVYVAISLLPSTYGWSPLFVSSYYNKSAWVVYKKGFSLKEYLLVRHSAVMIAMLVYHLFFYALMAALLFIDVKRPLKWRHLSYDQQWVITLFAIIFIRLMLYPDLGDRYNMGFYLIIIILLVKKISGAFLFIQKMKSGNGIVE